MVGKNMEIPRSLVWKVLGILIGLVVTLGWTTIDSRIESVKIKNTEQDVVIERNQEAIKKTLKELQRLSYAVFPPVILNKNK